MSEFHPVVGVILMVAITVIMAAVIAAFIFGMAENVQYSKENTAKFASMYPILYGSERIEVIDYDGSLPYATVVYSGKGMAELYVLRKDSSCSREVFGDTDGIIQINKQIPYVEDAEIYLVICNPDGEVSHSYRQFVHKTPIKPIGIKEYCLSKGGCSEIPV